MGKLFTISLIHKNKRKVLHILFLDQCLTIVTQWSFTYYSFESSIIHLFFYSSFHISIIILLFPFHKFLGTLVPFFLILDLFTFKKDLFTLSFHISLIISVSKEEKDKSTITVRYFNTLFSVIDRINTDLQWLTMGLCSYKPSINWKYPKSKSI